MPPITEKMSGGGAYCRHHHRERLRNHRVPRARQDDHVRRGVHFHQLPCVRRRQRQQLAPRASRWRRGGAKQIALAPREGQALEERPGSSRSAGRPRTAWRPLLPAAVRTTTTTEAARAAREQMAPRRRRADSPRTSRRAGAKGGPGKVGGDLAHRDVRVQQPCVTTTTAAAPARQARRANGHTGQVLAAARGLTRPLPPVPGPLA